MNFQEGEYVDIHVYRARVVRHVGDDLVVMYHGRERRIPLVPIDDDAANVVRVARVAPAASGATGTACCGSPPTSPTDSRPTSPRSSLVYADEAQREEAERLRKELAQVLRAGERDRLAAQVKRVREELIAEETRLLDARALVNPQKKRLLDDAARRLRVLADSIDEGAGR